MKFTLNAPGLGDFLETAAAKRHLTTVAERVADAARSEGQRIAKTGRFARSIEVLPPEPTPTGLKVTVTSSDPDAHLIEWGSKNNPPYAPFRKAINTVGLKLKTSRRP